MHTFSTPRTQPDGIIIHQNFMHYVAFKQKEVEAFFKAIAVNAVGQAFTLAALGIKVKAMILPNMSEKARGRLVLPKNAWVNGLEWAHNENVSQSRFLEMTCWQISGAVAAFVFDEGDYYGELGLEDIENSYDYLSTYESCHNVQWNIVLTGCSFVVEGLLYQHYDAAEAMAEQLFKQGSLSTQEMKHYLSGVHKVALGKQVLATFQEPWIDREAERVERMFFGS